MWRLDRIPPFAACLFPLTAALLGQAGPAQAQVAVISEFQAVNDSTLKDQDGDRPDWIEVHNPGAFDLDLGGWFLSDDAVYPVRWQFPQPTVVPAGGFLVVFASDKDRAVAGAELHTNFKLSAGGEFLGLVRPDGVSIEHAYAPAYAQQYADVSYGLTFPLDAQSLETYFQRPTPGAANGGAGPVLIDHGYSPEPLQAGQDLVVHATPVPGSLIGGSLELRYRIQYRANEWTRQLRDDGNGGDAVAADGIYSATIPGSAPVPGKMVRWYFVATDHLGSQARLPLYADPLNSPQYFGTLAHDPAFSSQVRVLHWFVQDWAAANTSAGTRAELYFEGRFYDNLHVRRRGGSSLGWPKKSYKFDFTPGNHFVIEDGLRKVEEFNLNTPWSDKSYLRRVLSWELFDLNSGGSLSFPVRLNRNGDFFQLTTFVEQVDKDLLVRNGADEGRIGALYKMYNVLNSNGFTAHKKTRLEEDKSDLGDLVQGLKLTGTTQLAYLHDHVDLPAVIDYIAISNLFHNNDHIAKNYYLYRDTEGDGEWRFYPWDLDLVLGRNYTLQGGVLNDTIWAERDPYSHPLFGDRGHPKNDGPWNRLIDAVLGQPSLQPLYLRRLRSLMDIYLQPPGTPRSLRYLEGRMDTLEQLISDEVALDVVRWGIPAYGDTNQDYHAALDILENEYLEPRRRHLYQTHGGPGGLVPEAQHLAPHVGFGDWVGDPVSGIEDESYLELVNAESEAVDISGWQLDGDVEFLFPAGSVIAAGGKLYLSPNPAAFRRRAQSPRGGESLLLLGPYEGELEDDADLVLLDRNGEVVATTDGPILVTRNFRAGFTAIATMAGTTPGALQTLAYSTTGGGPTSTPWGDVDLSAPIYRLPPQSADLAGAARFSASLPLALRGQPLWLQAYDHGTALFTAGVAVVVQ